MAGESRLYGDLRCFLVANFADHDLVGIVAQNGAQATGESQPFLFVHRNLGDTANLVLYWIFNGDDLVFIGLDLIQTGVQGCGLSAARRTCHQHHAIGLRDEHAEALNIVGAETHNIQGEIAKLLTHRFLVEHAQYGVFTMNGRHDGDTKINRPPAVTHPETTVLGNAALGDIQFAHHLDAGDDGGMVLFGNWLHGLLQHAVDPILDHHGVVTSLDMNIAGPALQRGENGGIHEPDDRAHVLARGNALNGDSFISVFAIADNIERKAFAGLFEHALRLLGLFQNVVNLRERRYLGGFIEQQADLINHHEPAGIGDGNHQASVGKVLQWHEVVAKH